MPGARRKKTHAVVGWVGRVRRSLCAHALENLSDGFISSGCTRTLCHISDPVRDLALCQQRGQYVALCEPAFTGCGQHAVDMPLDVLVLPARSQNRAAAHRFLNYLATEPALNAFNDAVATISPLAQGQSSADPLFHSSKAVLDATAGLSFYFDRDATADLIQPAFDAFRSFMRPPHDVDAAIRTIARRRR